MERRDFLRGGLKGLWWDCGVDMKKKTALIFKVISRKVLIRPLGFSGRCVKINWFRWKMEDLDSNVVLDHPGASILVKRFSPMRWKMKLLSIGGRLTLLKSVLGSMPIFHMSIFKVPSSILKSLESIRSRFFNGQDPKSNKASWVKWNKVLTPKDKGGLGVSSLFALNRGLMLKWVWRFYSQKCSLWTKVIKAIYGEGREFEQGCFWWSSNLLDIDSSLVGCFVTRSGFNVTDFYI
ncbi:hypothetical protein Tco_0363768 [Tanacetum coccineum]